MLGVGLEEVVEVTPQTDVTVYTQELDRITFAGRGLTANSVTLTVAGVDKVPTSVTPQSIVFDNLNIHPGDGVSVKSFEYPDGWFDIVVGAPTIIEVSVDGAAVTFNDRNECYVDECDEIQVTGVEGDNVQAYYYADIDESEGVVLPSESIAGGGVQFVNRGNPWGDSTYNAVKLVVDGVDYFIRYDAAYVDRIITNQGIIDFTEEDPSVPAPLTSVVVEGVNFKAPCELVYRDSSIKRIQPTLATDTRLEFYLTPALDPAEQIDVRIEATAVVAATFLVIPQS